MIIQNANNEYFNNLFQGTNIEDDQLLTDEEQSFLETHITIKGTDLNDIVLK